MFIDGAVRLTVRAPVECNIELMDPGPAWLSLPGGRGEILSYGVLLAFRPNICDEGTRTMAGGDRRLRNLAKR
jgi:hypothetical protein